MSNKIIQRLRTIADTRGLRLVVEYNPKRPLSSRWSTCIYTYTHRRSFPDHYNPSSSICGRGETLKESAHQCEIEYSHIKD